MIYNEKFKEEIKRIRAGNIDKNNVATVILDTERTESGEFIPCLVIEGEKGYYRTDWHWGSDKVIAESIAKERNNILELSPETIEAIIIYSMF